MKALHQWLSQQLGNTSFNLTPLAGDASLRRYFRVQGSDKQFILMDASAERDKCAQFIAIADCLRAEGLCTPQIFAQDLQLGYLLLTDFGDALYLNQLNGNNAEKLYQHALDALSVLSRCQSVQGHIIPPFTADFMRQELFYFQQWFLESYLNLSLSSATQTMLAKTYDCIVKQCAAQPLVFMHRDYHSANLMVLPENRVGILDFQDAFMGPVTYDLVSLLRDCYIEWPDELVIKLALYYWEKNNILMSKNEFLHGFDWMGIQRHLKALLTFTRKFKRDHNANYLQHIPRTLQYVIKATARYSELTEFNIFLRERVNECVL